MSSENIVKTLYENLKNAAFMVLLQYDGFCANALEFYGVIYFWTMPITIIGIVKCINKKDSINLIFRIWLITSLILMFICEPNITRMNIIYMPLIYYTVMGIEKICNKRMLISCFFVIMFVYSFIAFQIEYYKTDFTDTSTFVEGVENVIKYSKNINADKIYFQYSFKEPYIYILFYDQENPNDFLKTVEYIRERKEFNSVVECFNYVFVLPNKLDENGNNAYVMKKAKEEQYDIDTNIWKKTYIDDFVVIEKK